MQTVGRPRRIPVADPVGEDQVVPIRVEQLTRTEQDAGEVFGQELFPRSGRAVEDEHRVDARTRARRAAARRACGSGSSTPAASLPLRSGSRAGRSRRRSRTGSLPTRRRQGVRTVRSRTPPAVSSWSSLPVPAGSAGLPHATSHRRARRRARANRRTAAASSTATCGPSFQTGSSRQKTFRNPSIAQAFSVTRPSSLDLLGQQIARHHAAAERRHDEDEEVRERDELDPRASTPRRARGRSSSRRAP